jgi:hypothetical protein
VRETQASVSSAKILNKPEEPLAESEGPGIMRPRAGETEVEEVGYESGYVASEEGPAT